MAKFVAIPPVPTEGVNEWESRTLRAVKENLELITGLQGGDSTTTAVLKGSITVNPHESPAFLGLSASGQGHSISGVNVPNAEDYGRLLSDVARLSTDVATLRQIVNILIEQLKR